MPNSLYTPVPQQQTLNPFSANRPEARGSYVSTLVDAFARVFARNEPPQLIDTSVGVRLAAQQQNPIYPGGSQAFAWMTERLTLAQNRRQLYREYDEQEDNFPEIGSGLDIYADNVVSTDSYSEEIVSIVTDDERVGAVFAVLKQILNLDASIWTRAREIARAGEHFDEVVYDLTGFISRLKPLPAPYMMRNEDEFGILPFDVAFTELDDSFQSEVEFGKWQVLHYRLLRRPDDKYGTGLLFPIRRLCKKLALAEDALLISRLTRAHKRLVFDIPVDGMDPDARRKYVNDTKIQYRKRRVINPRTQKLDLESNPLAAEDDIFLGSVKDNKVDIKEIGGDPSVGELRDIEFWQNKLFSALKVPKAYLGIERDVNAKATLTEQDVQFARTVHRIQMTLQEQIRELMNRALTLAGIDPTQVEYALAFPAISLIDELRNWEIENLKLTTAMLFADLIRPDDKWMLTQYLGYTVEEAEEILANQKEEPELVAPGGPSPGSSNGNEEPEEFEDRASRRADLEKLFARGRQLHIIGQRAKRRILATEQAKDRKTLAKEMMKYRTLARPRGSGYSLR